MIVFRERPNSEVERECILNWFVFPFPQYASREPKSISATKARGGSAGLSKLFKILDTCARYQLNVNSKVERERIGNWLVFPCPPYHSRESESISTNRAAQAPSTSRISSHFQKLFWFIEFLKSRSSRAQVRIPNTYRVTSNSCVGQWSISMSNLASSCPMMFYQRNLILSDVTRSLSIRSQAGTRERECCLLQAWPSVSKSIDTHYSTLIPTIKLLTNPLRSRHNHCPDIIVKIP